MTDKKFKVIENYSTTEGTLYMGEVLKEDSNNTLEGHKRLKDSMGRVWFVPSQSFRSSISALGQIIYPNVFGRLSKEPNRCQSIHGPHLLR